MTSAPESQPAGSASRRAGAWGDMGTAGSSHPVRRYPCPGQPPGLAYGFRPGPLYRVTPPALSEASNNARTYRPRSKGMRI
jgi:hypothetical protein